MAKKPARERIRRFSDGPQEFRDFYGITPPLRRRKLEAALRPKVREPKVGN